MSDEVKAEKPNGNVVDAEIIGDALLPQQPYQLGRIGQYDPKKVVLEATEMANALAEVIMSQELFTVIKKRKYVHFEGWATLGGMMGIVPLEEYVREIEKGYEAKIKLIRVRDGVQVGAASSICTKNEQLWADREDYAVRSMAITRATSKAYRMSYSWIIKLAGFDPTPMEEAGQLAAVEALAAYQQREAEQMAKPEEKQKEVAEKFVDEHKTIGLVPWKEGTVALQGEGVSLLRSKLNDDEKKILDIKLDDRDKVVYIKHALAFKFSDIAKNYGYKAELR